MALLFRLLIETLTVPPSDVYLMELSNKFTTTCLRRGIGFYFYRLGSVTIQGDMLLLGQQSHLWSKRPEPSIWITFISAICTELASSSSGKSMPRCEDASAAIFARSRRMRSWKKQCRLRRRAGDPHCVPFIFTC